MGDSAQMAVQMALQTLKERCQNFQDRINELEKENVLLRAKCVEVDSTKQHTATEVDLLNRKIAELTEQKSQLKNNVLMVASENRELWTRLTKLMQVNKTLDKQLTNINDSLKLHNKSQGSPLIRSKTFTQEEPHLKLTPRNPIELDKISLELEDISLKLISNIAKEKNELEMQCSQMAEIQNNDINISSSFGFKYTYDDVDDSLLDFENHISDLKLIKDLLLQNKEQFLKKISNLKIINDNCKKCEARQKIDEKTTQETTKKKEHEIREQERELEELDSLARWGSIDPNEKFPPTNKTNIPASEIDKICPMCSKMFMKDVPFAMFQIHVESHFTCTDFEVL